MNINQLETKKISKIQKDEFKQKLYPSEYTRIKGERSIKNEIDYNLDKFHLIYERKLENSISHTNREAFFLTEISFKKIQRKNDNLIEDNVNSVLSRYVVNENGNILQEDQKLSLIFNSQFEGGNLCLVFKVNIFR